MKWLIQNVIVAFWAFLLGEVLTYITAQLEGVQPQYLFDGIFAIVVGLIAVNFISFITGHANPHRQKNN